MPGRTYSLRDPAERSASLRVRAHVLVVDDDPLHCQVLSLLLQQLGHTVATARTGREALQCFEAQPVDVAILDWMLGREDGLVLMRKLLALDSQLPVIMLTGFGSIEGAVEAVKGGAWSYLTKPVTAEALEQQLSLATERRSLTRSLQSLNLSLSSPDEGPQVRVLGRSKAMQAVFAQVLRIAPTRAPVVICGESGTGKEQVARLLHAVSPRADKPFVALNCGAIPEGLIESELFGHVRGAFTDARSDKLGAFREAEGGTLFLDECGEASLGLQVALLRVLQEWEVRPVGSRTSFPVDVRVVVASQRPLQQLVAEGRFREDLYYRVQVLPLQLPPLRDRGDDVVLLAEYFLRRYAQEEGRSLVGFLPEALEALKQHPWPGNVRQLENLIKRAVVLSTGQVLGREALFDPVLPDRGRVSVLPEPAAPAAEPVVEAEWTSQVFRLSLRDAREQFERHYLEQLLRETQGGLTEAARRAGRSRGDLLTLLRRHQLRLEDFEPGGSTERQEASTTESRRLLER